MISLCMPRGGACVKIRQKRVQKSDKEVYHGFHAGIMGFIQKLSIHKYYVCAYHGIHEKIGEIPHRTNKNLSKNLNVDLYNIETGE